MRNHRCARLTARFSFQRQISGESHLLASDGFINKLDGLGCSLQLSRSTKLRPLIEIF